jgi:cyclopropane-fatty-acyl-phospholipid synthase
MRLIPLALTVKSVLKTLDHVEYGTLRLTTPKGVNITAVGKQPGPNAQISLREWQVVERLVAQGDIGLGEDYIAGNWDSENIEMLLTFFLMNFNHFEKYAHGHAFSRIFFNLYNRHLRRNSKSGSRKNIQAHYDVGNDFYNLWLDKSMTYSSALFGHGAHELEDAQRAKYQRILDRIGDGVSSLLEIGCGWGGFADEASKKIRDITCLTISPAQHLYATTRLKDRAKVLLTDYRDVKKKFDAIVSIEMFEAVGEKYWPTYFKSVSQNLSKGGKAVIQTITMRDELFDDYRERSDFIRHYVFPGGMLPSLKRFTEDAEKAGLKCVDSFSFGQDYAITLREWLTRFDAKRDEISAMGYSEGFIRNWRFYLSFCAAAFAVGRTDVAQIELVHAV